MKTILIGLGNILMRDEGVGVHAINAVKARFDIPLELEVLDGGTAGLDLLPFFEGRDRVLLVDAVLFGEEPGFIGELADEAIPARFGKSKASLHHVGLAEVLALARLQNILPREICLLGIEPQSLEPGLELTETLQARFEVLMDRVCAKLRDWNVHLAPRRHSSPSP